MAALSVVCLVGLLSSCKEGPGMSGATGMAAGGLSAQEDQLVARYDQLAKDILKAHPNETEAQKKEEVELVRSLLGVYKTQADASLMAAKVAQGKDQAKPLESAIEEVTKIAQEGDKRVNDIKLQLQKGGHHHTKAEDGSGDEYVLVDTKTKKALTADADKLRVMLAAAKTGAAASAADIEAIQKDVDSLASQALQAKK